VTPFLDSFGRNAIFRSLLESKPTALPNRSPADGPGLFQIELLRHPRSDNFYFFQALLGVISRYQPLPGVLNLKNIQHWQRPRPNPD